MSSNFERSQLTKIMISSAPVTAETLDSASYLGLSCTIKEVTCDTPDAFHPCRFERFGNISSNRLFHGFPSPECDDGNKFSSSDGR